MKLWARWCSLLPMVAFAACRLEGRALEHELAKQGGLRIRMKTDAGVWVWVCDAEAASIRRAMRGRVADLLKSLQEFGFHRRRADCSLTFIAAAGVRDTKSVDLVLWDAHRRQEVLVEVKWSSRSMALALLSAERSFSWMRLACRGGRWSSNRSLVKAALIGALAVSRTKWELRLETADGQPVAVYPGEQPPPPKKSRSGRSTRSGWEKWRGGASPGSARWPSGPSGWTAHNARRAAEAGASLRKRPAAEQTGRHCKKRK